MSTRSRSIFIGAVAGAIVTILLSVIPVVGWCLGCIAILSPGLIAVWHYTSRQQLTLTGGEGVSLGAQAGGAAFMVAGVMGLLFWLASGRPSIAEYFERAFEQSQGLSPEDADQMLAIMTSPIALVVMILVYVVMFVVGGLIGGAIGASVFKGNDAAEI